MDHTRILDFYLLFPSIISGIRLMPQHRRFRTLANAYEEARPYGDQPGDAQIFARMKPMQMAARETLAEKNIVDAQELGNGNVVRTEIPLPLALATRVSEANAKEPELMQVISTLGSEYSLLGTNGLKNRTGLLDSRYDAV